jgi:hemerythrin-like domain-containing protein
MNATELLRQDHREVDNLIAMLEDTTTASTSLFEQLKTSLTLHAQVEEEIFYPAMEEFEEAEELVTESYEEHAEVKDLLEEMTGLNPQDEEFQDLLTQLKDSVQQHVEEEEAEMFPQAEELLGEDRLETIGNEIEQAKNDAGISRTASMR